ncbi:MAG: cytochrome ubiquinol oxidase subunit I, partial [Phycisphaerae bacterium]|nr:cytochrome ubiquinol oxidase subunit I [Phycisphaerae bacterium]
MARLHEWTITVDHKRLGIMYVATGLVFFVIAGLQATAMRYQLLVPLHDAIEPDTFNRLFTMHGTTMVFLVGMPILL